MNREDVINVTAGPSQLPLPVLEEAAKGLLNFQGTGMGITEISHRSAEFSKMNADLKEKITSYLQVPDTHDVIFTQGGGSLQFSAVVMNLLERHKRLFPDISPTDRVMDYVVTGSWTAKAVKEGEKLGEGAKVNVVHDSRSLSPSKDQFQEVGNPNDWKFSPNPVFVYYCENETVDGVQFDGHLSTGADPALSVSFPIDSLPRDESDKSRPVPLIGDFSSSFFSRPIPRLADYALVFAGAQKNLGPSGLTVLIARKDLLVPAAKGEKRAIPTTLDYSVIADSKSLYNTPPMFSMYVSLLVLEHYGRNGGLPALTTANVEKGNSVYAALARGEDRGVYRMRVKDGSRSWMNVVFELLGDGKEDEFFKAATKKGLRGFKGHRSVGGVRFSLYNGVTPEQTNVIVEFLDAFGAK